MTKFEWPDILEQWLAENWPHGLFRKNDDGEWIGFIYCKCRPYNYPALARVEPDRIVFIDQYRAFVYERCAKHYGGLLSACECYSPLIIHIANPVGFEQLATVLETAHTAANELVTSAEATARRKAYVESKGTK